MLIVYGAHRFKRTRVAYRRDFCLTCEQERIIFWIRSFLVGHLYGIPNLPLWFRKERRCSSCSQDPATRTRTSANLVAVFAALIAVVALMMSIGVVADPKAREPVFVLIVLGISRPAVPEPVLHCRRCGLDRVG